MKRTRLRLTALVSAALATGLVSCTGPHTPEYKGDRNRKAAPAPPDAPEPAGAPCGLRSTNDGAEGPTDFTTTIRPEGTVRALMIFVDFPDAPATENVRHRYDTYAPAQDWYRVSSNKRLDLRLDPVLRWFRMPRPSTAYQLERGNTPETHVRYIHDAIAAAMAADPSIDLTDHRMVDIVATLNATAIDTGATATYTADPPITVGNHQISTAITLFGDDEKLKYRVVVHETGHAFGLPDLYPVGGGGNGEYVGEYDVMGEEIGAQPDFLAWHKQKLGWITPEQIDCVTTPGTTRHHISPVETADGTKMAVVPTGPSTALAIEVRAKTGVDHDACRTGVLVYSVDTTVTTGEGPLRVLGPRTGTDPCGATPTLDTQPSTPRQYEDPASGTTIKARSKNEDGSYIVTVTRI